MKVPIDENTLVRRIQRKLAAPRRLVRTRSPLVRVSLGDAYVVDERRGEVVRSRIVLADFARELGVLANHEVLSGEAEHASQAT